MTQMEVTARKGRNHSGTNIADPFTAHVMLDFCSGTKSTLLMSYYLDATRVIGIPAVLAVLTSYIPQTD